MERDRVDSRQGWVVVVAITIVLTFTSGVRLLPGIVLKPVTEEFGWSRSELMLMITVNMVLLSLLQPIMGFAADRFGAKKILAFGTITLGLILIPLSRATEIWQFYFYYGVVGAVAFAAVSPVNVTSIVAGWFDRQRGAALSIATSGAAFGQLMIVPVGTWLLTTTDWSNLYVMLSATLLLVATPVALTLIRANSGQETVHVARAARLDQHLASEERPYKLQDALASTQFWLLSFGFFVCGFTMAFATAHFLSYADDMGMSTTRAADIVAATAIFSIGGSFLLGMAADRHDRRSVLAITYLLRGVAFVLLWLLPIGPWLFVYAVVLGISWTATTPLTAAISSDLYGRKNLGIIFGTMFSFMNIGFGAGSFLDGLVYDMFGSYRAALFVNALLGALAAVAALQVSRTSPALDRSKLASSDGLHPALGD